MLRRQSLHRRFGRISRSAVFCAALLFSLLHWATVHAQTTPQAKLFAVAQNGSRNFSSAEVAEVGGLQKGALVDQPAIQAAANRLAGSGLFSSVRYQYSTDVNGLSVTFQLQDALLFPVSLDNIPWVTLADLTTALNQAGIPFHGTAPAAGTINGQIAQQLQKMLEAKGVHATVAYTVSAKPGTDDEIIQFKAAGAEVKLASLQFTDPLASRDPAVQNGVASLKNQPYSVAAIERFDFQTVQPVYLAHSYLQVTFAAPVVQLAGQDAVQVTVPITPGPAYLWGGVAWNGNHAYTTADLNSLVTAAGLSAGQPADGNKIVAIWKSVREAYGHRGYIDATVEPKENFDAATHSAAYIVNISEGDQYHMGKLVLSGLSIDAERRLRASWKIPQGQVFDQTYCDFFISKGATDALKGLPAAQDKIGHYLQKNPQQHTVDVMIDFE
ncbi:MAG TPA: POTRA domain-containing protein [Candidatus Acidoferrales bacterium]|nr:POTRA domain-containing protein [Candidatus Acidoferrales bacterium]